MSETSNVQELRREVLLRSNAANWHASVHEWDVVSIDTHPYGQGVCVCGQPNLRWLYTIANASNGHSLYPIGSTCVQHFGRRDLDLEVSTLRSLADLRHAIDAGRHIDLTTEYFSRSLLERLRDDGAFEADDYNGWNGDNDHAFLRKMFGVRDKSTISSKQRWKVRMLIERKIVPFVLSDDRVG